MGRGGIGRRRGEGRAWRRGVWGWGEGTGEGMDEERGCGQGVGRGEGRGVVGQGQGWDGVAVGMGRQRGGGHLGTSRRRAGAGRVRTRMRPYARAYRTCAWMGSGRSKPPLSRTSSAREYSPAWCHVRMGRGGARPRTCVCARAWGVGGEPESSVAMQWRTRAQSRNLAWRVGSGVGAGAGGPERAHASGAAAAAVH